MERMLRNRWVIVSFLLPALIVFTFTVMLPICWSVYYSFFNWNGVSAMRFTGLDNFVRLFADKNFLTAFWNNIWYVLINLVGQVIVGGLAALFLTRITKGLEFFKTIYFAPTILAAVALSQFFQKFYGYDPIGILNALLDAVGLGALKQSWLGSSATSLVSVALIECYKNMALYMIIIYSGLVAIPGSILESATLDGAHGWSMFRHIKLPYLMGVVTVALVMAVNGLLKAFDIPYITTYGGPGRSSELVATYMYKIAFASTKYGYGSSIAVFLVVESLVIVSLLRWALSRRERI